MQLKESWKDWPRKLRARTAERSCAPAALAIARKSSAIFDEAPGWSAASTCLTLFRFGKRLGNGNSKNVAALRWGRNARKALGFPPGQIRTCHQSQNGHAVLTQKRRITGLSVTKMITALRILFSGLRFESVN
jgi:hypothetical protein